MLRAFKSYGLYRIVCYTQLTLSYLLLAFSMETSILQEPYYDNLLSVDNDCTWHVVVSLYSTAGLFNLALESVFSKMDSSFVAFTQTTLERWSALPTRSSRWMELRLSFFSRQFKLNWSHLKRFYLFGRYLLLCHWLREHLYIHGTTYRNILKMVARYWSGKLPCTVF